MVRSARPGADGGVELVKDRETKERTGDWRDQVVQAAFHKGLLIRFCPALTVSADEIEVSLELFRDVLRQIA